MHTAVTCLTDHGGVQQRTPSGDLDSKLLRHVRRAGVLGRGDGLILQGHSGGGSFRRDEHVSIHVIVWLKYRNFQQQQNFEWYKAAPPPPKKKEVGICYIPV